MANEAKAPLDAHGIELVAGLAVKATAPEVVLLKTEGLGKGLPEVVPVSFDRMTSRFTAVKQLIEDFRTAPPRAKGTATVETLKSFVDLTKRHMDAESALFGKATWPNPKLTAVLDYQSAKSDPRFNNHRVEYSFPLTDEFKLWVGKNAKQMEQAEFAAFIEEHAPELAAPEDGERSFYEPLFREKFATPSEVIELSRHLEVFVNAKAKQGIRLQSGERQVEFSEEHVNAKGEAVTIPGLFMLSVPAFIDGNNVRIPARLRYRVSGGSITWFYQLYRWENFVREKVEHALLDAAKETGLDYYFGSPEA